MHENMNFAAILGVVNFILKVSTYTGLTPRRWLLQPTRHSAMMGHHGNNILSTYIAIYASLIPL